MKLTSEDLRKHSKIGARTFNKTQTPEFVLFEIMKENPGKIEKFYGVEANGDLEVLLDKLGRKWGFLRKGNTSDTDKTSRRVLMDWQNGVIK